MAKRTTYITFRTEDDDLDEWVTAFDGILNTADNEEGEIITVELVSILHY